MRIFGLIGFPLSHSFSAAYFAEKFRKEEIPDTLYQNFPIENIQLLPDLIKKNPDLHGLNVTIPYKTQVLQYLNGLSESASVIGAVNTIKIEKTNNSIQLHGFNTDEYGFRKSLEPLLKTIHKKALILGTGGASKAVEYVFSQLNIKYYLVSRSPETEKEISYKQLTAGLIDSHKIIVNTSPIGMYPETDQSPDIPYEYISKEHILYDLIYNPAETLFMKRGADKGAKTINGLNMLHLQAEKAWEIWNK